MNKVISLVIAGTLALTIMAVALPGATAATASVVKKGHCSATSTWRLTLTRDHARIEADVEVQTPKAGQQWKSRFSDNGTLFGTATRTTVADGSFSATRFAAHKAGPDLIKVRSVNQTTGEVCKASATF